MEQWYRNFSVHLKGEPSKIVAIEQLIATLQTTQNLTRHQALLRIFEAGLQALAEDPSFASLDLKEAVELSRLFDLAKAKAARRREFRTIYQELGPEEILKVGCRGLDPREDTEMNKLMYRRDGMPKVAEGSIRERILKLY